MSMKPLCCEIIHPPAKRQPAMTYDEMSRRHTRMIYRFVLGALGAVTALDILIRISGIAGIR